MAAGLHRFLVPSLPKTRLEEAKEPGALGEVGKQGPNMGFFAYPPIRYISALNTGVAHEAGDTLR
jgi:hypothetical protein